MLIYRKAHGATNGIEMSSTVQVIRSLKHQAKASEEGTTDTTDTTDKMVPKERHVGKLRFGGTAEELP